MKTLYNNLPVGEQNEDEGIFTHGDDIAAQFYYGNFSDAVTMLREMGLRAKDFVEFMEDKAEEFGYENIASEGFYHGHFSTGFWVALGSEIY